MSPPTGAEQRIVLMNTDQWEDFILACCEQLRVEKEYVQVKPKTSVNIIYQLA